MTDEIVRAITGDGYVKAVAITGRDLVERARTIHTLLPMATAALGRALLGCSMMGDMLKEEKGAVTLQIKGGGPLGTVLAVSDCEGNVRGYVQNPHVELMEQRPGKLDVGAAVGETGTLTVIKDIGLKEPYVGSIGLFSGEIADDLAMYFVESEQIPTACALGVLIGTDQSVTSAGGYLIQLLPGASDEIITKIENGVRALGPVSAVLEGGVDGEGLLRAVLSEFQLEILEKHPVEYRCYCSRERVSRALISMGRGELTSLIAEQGQAELTCQFCDRVYHFSKEELEQLLTEMSRP
jgi:molecular chaperone Hsp33